MKREKLRELLQLYIIGEIGDEDKVIVENALLEDDDLKEEYESFNQLFTALNESKPESVSDAELDSARLQLLRGLRKEASKISLWDKTIGYITDLFVSNYQLALGGVATFAIGIFAGYLLFASGPAFNGQSVDLDNLEKGDVQISNIRFDSPYTSDGDIEFTFDSVKPVRYKGNPNDETTRRLLAQALITADNPGIRLRTVSTLGSQNSQNFAPDNKVKRALIAALKADENVGVRKEALNVLAGYPFDDEIRDAFLFVLSNDPNSGIRIAAVNAMYDLKTGGRSIDEEIKNELNKRAETDENSYIRLRAASLLQEVN